MFSNQTDPTGKFMNHMIMHCVIAQVRYMVSRYMVFEVVSSMFIMQNIYIGIISKQLGML